MTRARQARKPRKKKLVRYGHVSQNRVLEQTFVYNMGNIPFFFLVKFGVSDKTKNRRKDVSETTPGYVFTIAAFKLAFGYEVEQLIHGLYKLQNVHFWTGSGRTEWFFIFSPIVGTSMLFLNYHFDIVALVNNSLGVDWGIWILFLSFFTPFIWWDGFLWLLIFRAINILAVIGLVVFFWYALVNIE
jgi:hypothetical protein